MAEIAAARLGQGTRSHFTWALFVDQRLGDDRTDGLRPGCGAFKTLRKALALLQNAGSSGTALYLANGTYGNHESSQYGRTGPAPWKDHIWIVQVTGATRVLVTAQRGHAPLLSFNGSGGVRVVNSSHVEISGLTIRGPNLDITERAATADRLRHSPLFSGRGVSVVDSSGSLDMYVSTDTTRTLKSGSSSGGSSDFDSLAKLIGEKECFQARNACPFQNSIPH